MYSFGNEDHPLNCILLDSWHRKLLQPAPDQPIAYAPNSTSNQTPMLISSPISGLDSIMSSEFQITAFPGIYLSPVLDNVRDWENIYGDSGAPNYQPINLNLGIDLYRYQVEPGILQVGTTYGWRVRYRDQNLRWSNWSNEQIFTVVSSVQDSADFIANVTVGTAPLSVHFTDLSNTSPSNWSWDLNGDGTFDSNIQNPDFTYTSAGLFTVTLNTTINSVQYTKTKSFYINTQLTDIREISNSNLVTCFPNPFKNTIEILINKEYSGKATIGIYSLNGMLVNTILDEELQAGEHTIEWNACNSNGQKVSKGAYLLKYNDGKKDIIEKIIYSY